MPAKLLKRATPKRIHTRSADMVVVGDIRYSPTTTERILSFIKVRGEHWIWHGGHRSTGQPSVHIGKRRQANGKNSMLHAHPARLLAGDLPSGAPFLQQCKVTDCVNPAHYALMTQRQSVHKRFRTNDPQWVPPEGRPPKTRLSEFCKRGHRLRDAESMQPIREHVYISKDGANVRCRECCLNYARTQVRRPKTT